MHSPDSNTLAALAEQPPDKYPNGRSASQILSAMSVAIAGGDAVAAAELVDEAEASYPGDSSLAGALQKCKVIVRRAEWLDAAIHAVRHDLEEDRFASAVGHFREALGLSRGLPLLKARVDQLVERYAKELLPHNWRIAETMMQEAGKVSPPAPPDSDLLEKLKQARHDELVALTLHKAERLELDGKNSEARLKLEEFLAAYPKESRISQRIYALDHPDLSAAPELATKVPASEVQAMAASRPPDSELDTEGTLINPAAETPAPWRTRIMISNSAWTAVKNFSAIAATAVMLCTAGFLVWNHLNVKPRKPVSTSKSAKSAPAEQDNILQAVRAYSDIHGKLIADKKLDEVAINGNQASVRYRSKSSQATYLLVKQAGTWKIEGQNP